MIVPSLQHLKGAGGRGTGSLVVLAVILSFVLMAATAPAATMVSARAAVGIGTGGEGIVRSPGATGDASTAVLTRGSELDTAHERAALGDPSAQLTYVYDGPDVSRVGASVSLSVEGLFSQVATGGGGAASPAVATGHAATTLSVLTYTPRGALDTTDALPGYSSFRAAKKDLGSPGPGNVYDHVVEQSQIGRSGFTPQEIHNPFNLNPVSARTNQIKANYYSSKQYFTGGRTVRDWLNGQSFADQHRFGMDVLKQIERGQIR